MSKSQSILEFVEKQIQERGYCVINTTFKAFSTEIPASYTVGLQGYAQDSQRDLIVFGVESAMSEEILRRSATQLSTHKEFDKDPRKNLSLPIAEDKSVTPGDVTQHFWDQDHEKSITYMGFTPSLSLIRAHALGRTPEYVNLYIPDQNNLMPWNQGYEHEHLPCFGYSADQIEMDELFFTNSTGPSASSIGH